MANTNPAATISTAAGVAKRVHGQLQDLIPEGRNKLTRRVKFDKDNIVGSEFYEPVFLTGEHGATFTGNTGAAADLNGAEVAESKPASLNPGSIWFETQAVIDSLARMRERGDQAFANYVTKMMVNTRKGLDKRVEIVHNLGTSSLGTVSAATDAVTTTVITITAATWAPHIWLGMKNCHFDIYNGSTQINTNADFKCTKVDPKNHKITMEGNSADIDALVAVGTNGSGCEIYLLGYYGNTGPGLKQVCQLRSGQTLYGISSTDYNDVWAATQVVWDVTTTPEFTWELLQDGLEEAVGRGLERDIIAQVPYNVWTSLNSSLDALRVFDSSYKVSSVDMGHAEDAITYHSLGIKVTIEPSGFSMGGEILCYPNPTMDKDSVKIVGSQPITFDMPGTGKEMVYLVPSTNRCAWQAYTCQGFYTTAPRDFLYFGPTLS
jgi:hypothetical protein